MAIVDMIAALLMGALSGMGVGGGGLLVIYLTLLERTDQVKAQGLNLYFFLFASAAALFIHARKRKINYPLVLLLGVVGMPSAYLASLLASVADPSLLRVLFGLMLVLAGGVTLVRVVIKAVKNKKRE